MNKNEVTLTARQFKSQGRWALTFSIFSAFTLLMCAAFAEQTARKIHLPSIFIYTLASIGGVLTVCLNLGAPLDGISRRTYILMARAHSLVIVLLNIFAIIFVMLEQESINKNTLITAAIFLVFLVCALLSSFRLETLLGRGPDGD